MGEAAVIEDVFRFLGSEWFRTPFQLAMLVVYYRLGKRGAQIKMARAFHIQDLYVKALEEQLKTAATHIDNLQARLAEAQSAK